ncbi:hypothetical protein ODE01S_02160 [Oceanithermus desulfurans NBRC 100063]|uniref:Uncharacterized protein n=1 Tax=Oceanithermus desulfurans NBRC 100063 TaxID=1227550 RepID=A0A511RIJ6_9DEIN|nr:hypothetical protein ODE01S_02160 [Oceanithermus desulfurans NBRC 100063]
MPNGLGAHSLGQLGQRILYLRQTGETQREYLLQFVIFALPSDIYFGLPGHCTQFPLGIIGP